MAEWSKAPSRGQFSGWDKYDGEVDDPSAMRPDGWALKIMKIARSTKPSKTVAGYCRRYCQDASAALSDAVVSAPAVPIRKQHGQYGGSSNEASGDEHCITS